MTFINAKVTSWKILSLRCNTALEDFCLDKLAAWAICCEDNGRVYSKKMVKIHSKGCCMICLYGIFNKTVKHDPRFILIHLCLTDRDTKFTVQKVCLLRIQQPKIQSHTLNSCVLNIIRNSVIKIMRLFGFQDHYFKVISRARLSIIHLCCGKGKKRVTKIWKSFILAKNSNLDCYLAKNFMLFKMCYEDAAQ